MDAVVLPEDVSQLVAKMFLRFGARLRSPADIDETILVGNGRYLARSYRADGLMAMWFVAEGIVQLYDAAGDLLRTVSLSEQIRPHRAAA